MNYRNKKDVRVYNECPFSVNLVGQRHELVFPPCLDGEPTMNFVDFEDIEFANARYNEFKIGLLTFAEEEREDIYQSLGIKNWKETVWFNKDIEDTILHPTVDKMQRVIDIRDAITLERVRGMMVRFVNEKRDVSQNVISIINARYRELSSGMTTSKIVIRQSDVESPVTSDEVADLKRQLAEMQEMMKQMIGNNMQSQTDQDEKSESTGVKRTARKATTNKK